MATTPDIATVAMTRSFSWTRLISQLLVAVLLFVVANVVTYETSGFFQKEHEYQEIVAGIARHRDVRLVFAGDSHFAVPLNDYLDEYVAAPGYSVAAGGDSLRESFAKVRHVLNDTPGIDTLILTADPHMFGKGRLESSNRSFADRYFIEAWDSSGLQKNIWSALLQQVPLFNEDFLQYFRKDLGTLFSRTKTKARGAGDPLAWSRLTDEQRLASATETGQGDHAGVGDSQVPYMWYQRILDVAREHHVKVIGVRFPVHPGYSAQISPDKVAELNTWLTSHGVSQVIDLRNELTDPRDFEDEDHLNDTGAAKIVKVLEERLHRRIH
ncbi:MAG: hypothetical protein JSR66_15785 [Proteobacteria bacterium]|nr:hypothetical protein [Pseudomonadota bacterium]